MRTEWIIASVVVVAAATAAAVVAMLEEYFHHFNRRITLLFCRRVSNISHFIRRLHT